MSYATIPQTNGAAAHLSQAWLNQTVEQFFGTVNWADHPPEIQHLRLTAQQGATQPETQPLSQLTVSQFFNGVNWEGNAIASPPNPVVAPDLVSESDASLTLEDFSDLF